MIRLAVVEDEDIYVEQITKYLEKYQKDWGKEIQTTRFSDGDGIVTEYKGDYDIILMDIQMRFMDGMSAAEYIRKLDSEVIIIFITSMTEYAVKGYEVDALDYMVKPIHYFSFAQKLDRAINRIKKEHKHYIFIPLEDGIQKLETDRIYYVESQSHTMDYHTKEGRYTSRAIMRELEETLSPLGFFRCEKGYLVNMKYVEGIQEDYCTVCGEQITVSRRKRKAFMDAMLKYMSGVI